MPFRKPLLVAAIGDGVIDLAGPRSSHEAVLRLRGIVNMTTEAC